MSDTKVGWEKKLNDSMNDVIKATKDFIAGDISTDERDIVYASHGIKIKQSLSSLCKEVEGVVTTIDREERRQALSEIKKEWGVK